MTKMNLLNKILNWASSSHERKTLISNFSYLSVLQLTGYVFPLITMPYLARVIGPEGFGRIAFALAIIVWIQTIADWGFSFTATRDVAQHRDNQMIVSEILSKVLCAKLFLAILTFLILCVLILTIPIFKANAAIILITYLTVPSSIIFPDWFFQAIEKMKYTTIFNLIIKFIFTILVFVLINEEQDFVYQPLLTVIGYLICGLIALYLIFYRWNYKFIIPDFRVIIKTIQAGTNVFLNNLVPNLYNSFSTLLLTVYGGPAANGIYDGGNKFAIIFTNLQSVISRTFFPFLSRRSDKHSVFAKINISISLLASLFLFVSAPLIVEIMLGNEFIESILVLRILSLSIFFLALNDTYGTNYLIVKNHERELRNIAIISSIVGFLVAYPLVKFYTYIGAALTIFISRFLLGVLTYFQYRYFVK